jgi:hypothetical protein
LSGAPTAREMDNILTVLTIIAMRNNKHGREWNITSDTCVIGHRLATEEGRSTEFPHLGPKYANEMVFQYVRICLIYEDPQQLTDLT